MTVAGRPWVRIQRVLRLLAIFLLTMGFLSCRSTPGQDEKPPATAGGWLEELENQFERARTIRLKLRSTYRGVSGTRKEKVGHAEGTLLMDGKKLSFNIEGKRHKEDRTGTILSDGESLFVDLGRIRNRRTAAPPDLRETVLSMICHLGLPGWYPMFRADPKWLETSDPFEGLLPTKQNLGPRELRRGKQCQIIEYLIPMADGERLEARLWIDLGTFLPVRRVLHLGTDERGIEITEDFARVELDKPIDRRRFTLPE